MAINRYKMKHQAKSGHRGAALASKLLETPDRLIGLILLGNNLVNNATAALAGNIGYQLSGSAGIAIATAVVTIFMLLFAEVTPKTLAALYPERVAYPAAYVYTFLMKFCYPIVWVVNLIANGVLRLFGVRQDEAANNSLSREELRTVVNEADSMIPKRHQNMLLSILDLENVTVEDIMIPRNEIVGINLDDPWEEIELQIRDLSHTRVPVYRESIDNIVGVVHAKRILRLLANENFDKERLESSLATPYFVPEGSSLMQQMINFQNEKRRLGMVVDEYGDILGMVTLEEILEEIVGEFTTDALANNNDIIRQNDGSFLIDGSTHIRDINKSLKVKLPSKGPKTLNGLILEHMEIIPEPGTSLLLNDYPIEIVRTANNAVKTARLHNRIVRPKTED